MNIQYPNITGKNSAEQLVQIRSYLYQLVQQLNMESGVQVGQTIPQSASLTAPFTQGSLIEGVENTAGTPMSTFNQVKSLIIKSAEIVDAYYAEINKRLDSVYVAESDFGDYKKVASAQISANAERIEQTYSSVQSITGQLNTVIATQATIRSGRLFTIGDENLEPELGQNLPEGTEINGIEVGQIIQVNGKEIFNKFARFTSYGLTLYDKNGDLTACFTDAGMHISNVTATNSLRVGGFKETVNADGSSVERWVGA